ncbi:nuclear transport factor 2 family protein [candidate division KSB1 bacterium]|nr:nuclear transport factor 2 family protein [candidate division KSB1 bacterium]
MSTNANTVREIYEAFGRGDIPAILAKLDENVEWEYGAAPHEVPWLQPRRGRTGAAEFFASLAAVEFHSFVPKAILEGENLVVALTDLTLTVKKTGKKIVEEDEAHIWRFNAAGKVVRFRHCADTNQQVQACRG